MFVTSHLTHSLPFSLIPIAILYDFLFLQSSSCHLMTTGEQYTIYYSTIAYSKKSYVRSRFISRLGLTVTNDESHLHHLFDTITIFTITTVTATVNEELFQKVPHEVQLPKNNSSGFPSVLLHPIHLKYLWHRWIVLGCSQYTMHVLCCKIETHKLV